MQVMNRWLEMVFVTAVAMGLVLNFTHHGLPKMRPFIVCVWKVGMNWQVSCRHAMTRA